MLEKARSLLKRNRITVTLLLIILLGCFLRFYDLAAESLWLDEAHGLIIAKRSVSSILESTWSHPPLYNLILHFWMPLFGDSEFSVRFPSAVFGVVSIFLMYKVGCALFDRKTALISSFILSISWFHIHYSQEARNYSLLVMLTLLSFLFFIKALKSAQRRRLYFVLLILANFSIVFTHYFGLLIIISQVFYLILFWKKYRQLMLWFLGVQVVTLACFSPWMIRVVRTLAGRSWGAWISEPSFKTLGGTIAEYSGYGWERYFLAAIFFLLFLLGLFTVRSLTDEWRWSKPLSWLKALKRSISLEHFEERVLLLIWLTIPILIPFIISKFYQPIYVHRYTIAASPALYLLASRGLSTFNSRRALYPLILIIAALSFSGLYDYYADDVKEQWRETAILVEHHAQENDVIIFCEGVVQISFDYYYRGDLEKFGIDKNDDLQGVAAVIDSAIEGKERVWLILSHDWTVSYEIRDFLAEELNKETLLLEKEFVDIEVYLFELQPD